MVFEMALLNLIPLRILTTHFALLVRERHSKDKIYKSAIEAKNNIQI